MGKRMDVISPHNSNGTCIHPRWLVDRKIWVSHPIPFRHRHCNNRLWFYEHLDCIHELSDHGSPAHHNGDWIRIDHRPHCCRRNQYLTYRVPRDCFRTGSHIPTHWDDLGCLQHNHVWLTANGSISQIINRLNNHIRAIHPNWNGDR